MTKIRVANAPCSWGSLEFDGLQGKAIGYARMLDELVDTGYGGTELGDWGYMPTDPARLHAELSSRGLVLLGAFVPVALKDGSGHEQGQAECLKIARLLADVARRAGQDQPPLLVLADDNGTDPIRTRSAGRVERDMGLSDAQWEIFAREAETIARAVKQQTDLPTVFHHHCAGYVETPMEIARLMALTDPCRLGLVFDTGHFAYGCGGNDDGGASMMELLRRQRDRIWYVHFKDCDPRIAQSAREGQWDYFEAVRRGVFCELGRGCVDFPGIVQWLLDVNYDGWVVVEQDVLPGMGTPKESARHNREYLRSLGV